MGVAGQTTIPNLPPNAAIPLNVNHMDFRYLGDPNTVFDLNSHYADVGVDANVKIKETGAVKVPDDMSTAIPKADKKYKIGFSIFYTLDEVDAMILESMKTAADEAGVELLVNDANYKQDVQNQAVEQWILEGGGRCHPCTVRLHRCKDRSRRA